MDVHERFWRKVQKTEDCWLWTSSVDVGGRGVFWTGEALIGASKMSFTWAYGDPDWRKVHHRCGNLLCVRPDHLFTHEPLEGIYRSRSDAPCAERFWGKVAVKGPDDCWQWQAAINANGYGSFARGGMILTASRVAYELEIGPIPDAMVVMHTCDNRPCCNPAHLRIGTHGDNSRDCEAKGRRSHEGMSGESNPMKRSEIAAKISGDNHPFRRNPPPHFFGIRNVNAKVTDEMLAEIRAELPRYATLPRNERSAHWREVAARHGLSYDTIYHIAKGTFRSGRHKRWQH